MLLNLIRVTRSRRFLKVLQANTSALQTHSGTDYSMGTVLCFKTEKRKEEWKVTEGKRREGKGKERRKWKRNRKKRMCEWHFQGWRWTKSYRPKSGRDVASSATTWSYHNEDSFHHVIGFLGNLPLISIVATPVYIPAHNASWTVFDDKCRNKLPFLWSLQRTHPPAVGKRFYIIKK